MISAALLLAAATAPVPYKLMVIWYQSGLTVVDYPSAGRCEAARRAIKEEIQRRNRENDAAAPPGSVLVSRAPNDAFCIPG